METLFVDLHVHTVNSQEKHANLSVKETLKYYQTIGERAGKRVIIRINEHNNIFGGVEAVEEFLSNKDKYKNIFVIPGIEFSTNLSQAIKYVNPEVQVDPEFPHSDEKFNYVFKKMHIGAAPILNTIEDYERWKNNVDLQVYSKLSMMKIDDANTDGTFHFNKQKMILGEGDINRLNNVGEQIIACKNLLRKKYGVTIPYSYLEPCVQDGMYSYEILNKAFDLFAEYMKAHYEPFKKFEVVDIRRKLRKSLGDYYYKPNQTIILNEFRKLLGSQLHFKVSDKIISKYYNKPLSSENREKLLNEIREVIVKSFNKVNKANLLKKFDEMAKPLLRSAIKSDNKHIFCGNLKTINIDELCNIVKEAGGIIDFEHPNEGFRCHDGAKIPAKYLKIGINPIFLNKEHRQEIMDMINNAKDNDLIDFKLVSDNDFMGMIKVQVLKNALFEKYSFNKDYIGAEIPKKIIDNPFLLEKALDMYSENHILANIGMDKHMNKLDRYAFPMKDKTRVYDKLNGKKVIPTEAYFVNKFHELESESMAIAKPDYYRLQDDRLFHKTQKDFDTNEETDFLAHATIVTQTAFCDAVLGKDVNFEDSSMFTLKPGSIVKYLDEDELNK